jgi:hypothetical protein
MKNLIILLMLVSSAFPQEPVKIKLFVPNHDWAKVCHAITRMMGPPIMQGTEVSPEGRKLSDGTEVFPHGYQGERVVYRQSSWIKGTIAVSARTKVAPETEAIEIEVTITDTPEKPD